MPLNRVRVAWSNFPGAPGVSTHYFSTTQTDMTALRTFYNTIKDLFPNGLTTSVPNSGDVIQESDGQIIGTWTGTGGGTNVSAVASAAYSGPSGAIVRWITPGIVAGRRVVGRTYLVPLERNQYDTSGSLASTTITTIQNAAQAMLASYADGFKVWSRPGVSPPRVGSFHTALAALVPDLAAVRRSRRI